MDTDNLKVGEKGEQLAENYLKKKGYSVLERNYKNKYGEIDLIAQKSNELVFIEVRSKTENDFGMPEETVKGKKKKKLKQNALAYTTFNNYDGFYRIDLVCVVFTKDGEIKRLTHHENIIN